MSANKGSQNSPSRLSEEEKKSLIRLLPALHSLEETRGLLIYFGKQGLRAEKIYEAAKLDNPSLPTYQELMSEGPLLPKR